MRIVFFGTPEFAQSSLEALVQSGANVVGVVTAPDRPAGRGLQVRQSSVKQYAVEKEIPVLQPKNLKSEEFLFQLRNLKADLQVIVAFRMLPEVVWNMPPKGTFNLHASLLPDYRGAAPIHWVIINGETETGLTTFFLRHAIDTGNLIFQEKVPIKPDETTGQLHDRMKEIGARLVVRTVEAIAEGNVSETPQDLKGEYKKAPKIFRDMCQLDLDSPAEDVFNKIRGLSPFPGAYTDFDGEPMKIYQAEVVPLEPDDSSSPVGTRKTTREALYFRAQDGWIRVLQLQFPGKRVMTAADFLRGWKPDYSRR